MNPVKLVIIGGFLGAGKTTSLLSIAERLARRGNKVGIVTNDQGSELVDTAYLRHSGFPVLEVAGGCFCCHFDQFADRLEKLAESDAPDYILAEPVGSCTDLIATLLKPLRKAGRTAIALAPLSVVVDPKRLHRVMMDQDNPLPNEIHYLFGKQLEEADLIVVNKTDKMDADDTLRGLRFLESRYPAAEVIPVSALTGAGVEDWTERLGVAEAPPSRSSLGIDYDTYARAEEMLGWMNGTVRLSSAEAIDGNQAGRDLMEWVRNALAEQDREIAHMKMYLVSGSDHLKMSLTSLADTLSTDHRLAVPIREATLIVNIRALSDPALLKDAIMGALRQGAEKHGFQFETPVMEAFRPSYPTPVHRLS